MYSNSRRFISVHCSRSKSVLRLSSTNFLKFLTAKGTPRFFIPPALLLPLLLLPASFPTAVSPATPMVAVLLAMLPEVVVMVVVVGRETGSVREMNPPPMPHPPLGGVGG